MKEAGAASPLGLSQAESESPTKRNKDQDRRPKTTRQGFHELQIPGSGSRSELSDKGSRHANNSEPGGSHFASPLHHVRPGHPHSQSHSLRSDTYLRQALTSPYNQRSEKHSSLDYRNKDAVSAYSPYLHRDGGGSPLRERDRARHAGMSDAKTQESGTHPAADHILFKTPKTAKRMMFATPDRDKTWKDRAASASSSPASSSSGGSSHRLPSHNPFEVPHDRMHFPVFSPSMFNLPETPGRAEETFQWNLEHIAELRPIHIDEKEIRRQMSRHSPDEEAEVRAQRAIDYYFQHHMVAPSPWSETPPPHVLPVTPAYGQGYFGLMEETPNDKQGSIQKDLKQTKNASDKSCQTQLTLPMDFDMEKVLGDYLTYQEGEDNSGRDSMSSSSLRRKLFFNADTSSILSPVRTGQRSPDHVSAALCTPPHPKKSTPEWERGSPIHTPSSVQFSSSPIRGPLEGDFFRASFDHDGLASPELSPIAEKHRVKSRRSRGLFTDVDHGESSLDLGFGSGVRQQLQMEVHDGMSPPPLPSPDVSPIAGFGSGTGHHSKSRTLRADMSTSLCTSPQHASSHLHISPLSPLAFPFSTFTQGGVSPRPGTSVSMDTDLDLLSPPHRDLGGSSRDLSMTEVGQGDGEIGFSVLDPSQQPGSSSNLDTGYQTGSGNGSLQTTQDCGISTTTTTDNVSTEAVSSQPDTGVQLKKLAAKLQSSVKEAGFALRAPGGETKAGVATFTEESSVDRMGSSVDGGVIVHSNLTNQFMSLPFRSELSADGVDLETSLRSLGGTAAADSRVVKDFPKSRHRDSSGKSSDTGNSSTDSRGFVLSRQTSSSVDLPVVILEGGSVSRLDPSKQSKDVDNDEHVRILAQDVDFYDRDAEFLAKVADYLSKGGDERDSGKEEDGENVAPGINVAPEINVAPGINVTPGINVASATASRERPDYTDKEADDSVLHRARQYLASVNQPQLIGKQPKTPEYSGPPLKPLGSSTPTKRLMGRVAEDLAVDRLVDTDHSPALASEVAMEILRRAELDLKRVKRAARKTDTS